MMCVAREILMIVMEEGLFLKGREEMGRIND